jgi:hypothetical protein
MLMSHDALPVQPSPVVKEECILHTSSTLEPQFYTDSPPTPHFFGPLPICVFFLGVNSHTFITK